MIQNYETKMFFMDLKKYKLANSYEDLNLIQNNFIDEIKSYEKLLTIIEDNYYKDSKESIGEFFKKALEMLKTILTKLILAFQSFLKGLQVKISFMTTLSKHQFYLKFKEENFTENIEMQCRTLSNGKELALNSNYHRKFIESMQNNINQSDSVDDEKSFLDVNFNIKSNVESYIYKSPITKMGCKDYINQSFGSAKNAVKMLKDHFLYNLKMSHTFVSGELKRLHDLFKEIDKGLSNIDEMNQDKYDQYKKDKNYFTKLFTMNHLMTLEMLKIRKTVAKALALGVAGKLVNNSNLLDDNDKKNLNQSLDKNFKDNFYLDRLNKDVKFEISFKHGSRDYKNYDDNLDFTVEIYKNIWQRNLIERDSYIKYTNLTISFKKDDKYSFDFISKQIEDIFGEPINKFYNANIKETINRFLNLFIYNFSSFIPNKNKNDDHIKKIFKFFDIFGMEYNEEDFSIAKPNLTIYLSGFDDDPVNRDIINVNIQIIPELYSIKLNEDDTLYHTSTYGNIKEISGFSRPNVIPEVIYTCSKSFWGFNVILDKTIKKFFRSKKVLKKYPRYVYKAINPPSEVYLDHDADLDQGAVCILNHPVKVLDITDAVYAYALECQ